MSVTEAENSLVKRDSVLGSRRLSNLWWATVTAGGGLGFLLAGISSYTHINLLPFSDPTSLAFIPQGIVMGFYGVAGLLLSTYLWLMVVWDVGGGVNEFDRAAGKIRILRRGFPGKNRQVELLYNLDEVQSVRVDIKDGFNPRRVLYLRLKGKKEIPLTRVGQPISLAALEDQAAGLARFLNVPVEGL
ncbi:MAG: photosystem I assembly protein Ycf4 [Gloeomargaritaceae cyanobacterium C42_A2020_066]|nr:photosystem I assembly protein Ycf4 [Gloeomargaritaceae cyanobacterium C42_A2020_066]